MVVPYWAATCASHSILSPKDPMLLAAVETADWAEGSGALADELAGAPPVLGTGGWLGLLSLARRLHLHLNNLRLLLRGWCHRS